MLEKLYIENVAVIEKTEIDFGAGFNILTGETGAGKSIIIDSLSLLLGQRASRDMVRTGAQKAYVAATFGIARSEAAAFLAENDIEPDENEKLLIERSFGVDGKTTARINGRPVALSLLKELSVYLVNIHGQHLNQRILDPQTHIGYIDDYGNYEPLLSEYAALYGQVSAAKKEYLRLKKIETEKAERQDILRFRLDEIEKAALRPGEEEELTEKRNFAAHAEKISSAASNALSLISEGDCAAYDLLVKAQSELARGGQYSAKLDEISQSLAALLPALSDSVDSLKTVAGDLEDAPMRLDEIDSRLSIIRRMKSKYGKDVPEILEEAEQARKELAELEFSGENLAKKEAEFHQLASELAQKSEELTAERKAAGARLATAVMETLEYLDMKNCRFVVNHSPAEKYTRSGHDEMEFYLSANPGEDPRPLAKIASGGELSRIMLAIVHVLSEKDQADTVIFDEVDSGVSGKTAQKIGVLLKRVSRKSQVLCVTHLAQIAAMADHHLLIRKNSDGEKTYTGVTLLDESGRRREVARIIGGMVISDSILRTADELIAEGKSV